jgi:hypothetical protein
MEVAKKPDVKNDLETRVFEVEAPPTYSACLRNDSEFGDEEEK